MSELLLDAAGRRRSPATLPDFHAGRPPRSKGIRYPADPPAIEEIVAVMRRAGDGVCGRRLRGLIVVLWRAGLRIHEALALAEADLDARRGSLLVRRGEGGRRREVGMTTGPGNSSRPGSRRASSCPSDRCSASSRARPADGHGRPPRRAPSCDRRRGEQAPCGGDQRHARSHRGVRVYNFDWTYGSDTAVGQLRSGYRDPETLSVPSVSVPGGMPRSAGEHVSPGFAGSHLPSRTTIRSCQHEAGVQATSTSTRRSRSNIRVSSRTALQAARSSAFARSRRSAAVSWSRSTAR